MAADWSRIKKEYVTTDITLRELAKKHSVSESTLFKRCSKEKWEATRKQQESKVEAKFLEKDANRKADRAIALMEAADLLLEKTIGGMSAYRELPATAAKNYSDALKNIKEVHMIRYAEDIREQEARIAKLQKDAQDEDKSKSITITLEGDLSRYAQ